MILEKGSCRNADPFFASDNVNYRQFKLNSSGKIVKNKTVKDGNDDEWKTAANGEIVQFGNSHVAEVVEPDADTE